MFADRATIDLDGAKVRITRLTLKEIRETRALFARPDGGTLDETYTRLITDHATLADGSPLPVEDLSMRQVQRLVTELVGIPEGSGISDFIGLLC